VLRRVRVWLFAVGGAMVVLGALGLAFGWGSSASTKAASSGASSSSTPAPNSTEPASSTPSPTEDPHVFFDAFETAVRTGDTNFLVSRMHPAVIARYGAAQCRAFAPQLVDATASLHLVSIAGPASFDYTSDGLTTTVPDTFTFTVDGTAAGRSGPREFHFAVSGGQLRLFADCGDPVATGSNS